MAKQGMHGGVTGVLYLKRERTTRPSESILKKANALDLSLPVPSSFSKNSLLFVCSCFLRVGIHSSSSLSSLHFFSKVDDYSPPTASRRQKHRPLLQTPLTLSLSLSLPPYHHALRRLNCVFKVCFKLAHDTKYPKFFFYTIYIH